MSIMGHYIKVIKHLAHVKASTFDSSKIMGENVDQ